MKTSFTPTEKRNLVITASNTLAWENNPTGDLVTHREFTNFTLYLQDLTVLDEGSYFVKCSSEVLVWLWKSFLITEAKNDLDNLIYHLNASSSDNTIISRPNYLRNVVIGHPETPKRAPSRARGFLRKVKIIVHHLFMTT